MRVAVARAGLKFLNRRVGETADLAVEANLDSVDDFADLRGRVVAAVNFVPRRDEDIPVTVPIRLNNRRADIPEFFLTGSERQVGLQFFAQAFDFGFVVAAGLCVGFHAQSKRVVFLGDDFVS